MNPDGRADPVSSTGGVTTIGGRDSWLGLRSSWGALQAGGFGTPFKGMQQVWGAQPSLGHGGIIMGNGDTTGISPSPNCANPVLAGNCANQAEGNALAFSRRVSNFIQYETPNMSGFVGKIATTASEHAEPSTTTTAVAPGTSQSKPQLWSYSLTWSGGPWSLGAAYETHKGFRATNTVGSDRMARDKAWTVGGKWTFAQGQIGAGWESMDYGNAGTSAALGNNAFKQKFWVINGSFKITPAGTLSAAYSKTPGRKSCGDALTLQTGGLQNVVGGGCGDITGAKHLSLGYDHALSKRTSLYALYSKIDNNGNQNGGAGYYYIAGPTGNAGGGTASGPGAVGANGIDVNTYAVGVRHSF